MNKRVNVVGALIFNNNNEFLIFKRPSNKMRGNLWEFIGGKVEPSETKVEALKRECTEEIGTSVEVLSEFIKVNHDYPDIKICLTIFEAQLKDKSFELLEHQDYKWIKLEDIDLYEFCPADYEVLEKIKKEF